MAILIGRGATSMSTATAGYNGKTAIDKYNSASASGVLNCFEFYAKEAGEKTIKVGTFYNTTGNYYACRDWQYVTYSSAGYNKMNLALKVETGDYIGFYDSGDMYFDKTSATHRYATGDGTLSTLEYTSSATGQFPFKAIGLTHFPLVSGVRL